MSRLKKHISANWDKPPNEAVEKLFFPRAIPGRAMIESAISYPEGD